MDSFAAPEFRPEASRQPAWREQVRDFLSEAKGAVSLGLIGAVVLSLLGVSHGPFQWFSLLGVVAWPLLRRANIL